MTALPFEIVTEPNPRDTCSACGHSLPVDEDDGSPVENYATLDGLPLCDDCGPKVTEAEGIAALRRVEAWAATDPEVIRARQDADYDRRMRKLEGQEKLDAAMRHSLEVRRNRGTRWVRLLRRLRRSG